jgi:demethylmenaquinone methyltransferase/2-methoxy-6-polyprenyl-1,4-benzoquinol methylase
VFSNSDSRTAARYQLPFEKAQRVAGVFDSVADKYDLMNDLMSLGLHRLWKAFAIEVSGVRAGDRVLDVAGGTADLSLAFARRVGSRPGLAHRHQQRHADARPRPPDRPRLHGAGGPVRRREAALPLRNHFDCVSCAFGLRNMTHKEQRLAEMARVLRPGGRLLVLEFSKVWKPLEPAYDFYSFKVLPWLGSKVVNDAGSYRTWPNRSACTPTRKRSRG